jgi:hypothetical protein
MSLWLALMWFVVCAVGFVIFILCRKRKADIGHDVVEEVDHAIRRIHKAAREAEEQLRDAFFEFRNLSEAVREFQKSRGETEGVPRASPTWSWSDADLDLLRKRSVANETARRYRPWAFASIVCIVALTVGTAVASVILSNSEPSVLATPANTVSVAGSSPPPALPAPVNGLPPTSTPGSLPTLPTASTVPPDITSNTPSVAAQGMSNGVPCAQGGVSTQPPSGQAGQTQVVPTSTTTPAGTAGDSLPPQPNPPTLPQAPPAPAVSTANAPAAPSQDASNGMTSATADTSNPNQSGVDP